MADNQFAGGRLSTGSPAGGPQNQQRAETRRRRPDLQAMGNEVLQAARERTDAVLSAQKERAAAEIDAAAMALRDSVKSLDPETAIARYAEDAADGIGDFARRLRTGSWADLAADIEDFARRWPVAFVASAIGAGFLAGRFLTASASRPAPAAASAPLSPSLAAAAAPSSGSLRRDADTTPLIAGYGNTAGGPAGPEKP